jgi:zinc transport system permease protein
MQLIQFDFLAKALLAGLGVALVAGPLGSLIVWRRMANFGDVMGHSTLSGVCLALLLNMHLYFGLFAVCILTAIVLAGLSRQKQLANETLLSILAQTVLALGLIFASLQEGVRVDLLGYLYGDILAINSEDLYWILGIDVLVWLVLVKQWRSLLSITIHEDLARVEGVPVDLVKWAFMILIAAVFAIAMKLVGALLIIAMLIIPASTARTFAKTPESMVTLACVFGVISVVVGITLSNYWDWPTGPAIVVVSFALFIMSYILALTHRLQS